REVNKLYFMREKSPELAAEIENLFSAVKGDTENSYEFYTMSRTNFWGRKAKWLTENGKKSMLLDMDKIKQRIYEISLLCCKAESDNFIVR
ncbi:MAG: hypothetical protein K2L19_10305, partial [Eubacterium sp.]|nr:hypothetical protein [Eubacterium sp.]